MAIKEVLLLGNPKLYQISDPVSEKELPMIQNIVPDLHNTLMDFRSKYGAGRAIAAPQIGVMKRLIYLHIREPLVLINPVLTIKNRDQMIVWDDCLCFPDLLVKVHRYKSCSIRFYDQTWQEKELDAEGDLSELLQHEYDHLDGVLAVSKAVDPYSFALRSQRGFLS